MSRNLYDFNSIMVQLKHFDIHREDNGRGFQFHNGTIKTLHRNHHRENHHLFQFHNGTIKTITEIVKEKRIHISIP